MEAEAEVRGAVPVDVMPERRSVGREPDACRGGWRSGTGQPRTGEGPCDAPLRLPASRGQAQAATTASLAGHPIPLSSSSLIMLGLLKRCSIPAVAALALLAASFTSASPPKSLLAVADDNNGVMSFDTATYNKIVNSGAEEFRSDHSLIVLLTANRTPGVDCGPCRQFQPGYDEVATAWRKKAKGWSQGQAGHYFAQVEFNEGREIFQQVRTGPDDPDRIMSLERLTDALSMLRTSQLELNYAPVVLFIPKGAPASKAVKFQFERHGFTVDAFSNWASDLMGTSTGYRKPFPWRSVLTFSAAALVTTGAALYAIAKLSTFLEARSLEGEKTNIWKLICSSVIQAGSLALIVICCAGYMWNVIRGSPFVQVQGDGKIEYFSRQFQHQLAVETLIVAALCEFKIGERRSMCASPAKLTPINRAYSFHVHRQRPSVLSRSSHPTGPQAERPNKATSRGVRVERHPSRGD